MTGKLFVSAIAKFTAGVVLIGALIFAPAGTLHYPQGWLFMAILFVPMFAGKPTIIFFLLVLLITVFLTNFMINMVVAVIMMAATLPMVPVLGLDPLQVVYLITIACTIAFMLPASSQAACFLFANKDWVRAKDMYGYAFPTIILFSIIIMVWNVIFFAIF